MTIVAITFLLDPMTYNSLATARGNTPALTQSSPYPIKVSYDRCLMRRFGQCCLGLDGDDQDESCTQGIEWIGCENCGGWYHSVCVGLGKDSMATPFYCMCNNRLDVQEM